MQVQRVLAARYVQTRAHEVAPALPHTTAPGIGRDRLWRVPEGSGGAHHHLPEPLGRLRIAPDEL